jgi:hypothetical protein
MLFQPEIAKILQPIKQREAILGAHGRPVFANSQCIYQVNMLWPFGGLVFIHNYSIWGTILPIFATKALIYEAAFRQLTVQISGQHFLAVPMPCIYT